MKVPADFQTLRLTRISGLKVHKLPEKENEQGLGLEVNKFWEVLNGVGVDGVGVIFPFFYAFFRFFTHYFVFFSLFFVFLRFSLLLNLPLKDKGKQQQFTAKMRNFTPTPSAPTPCRTSRNFPMKIKRCLTGFLDGAASLQVERLISVHEHERVERTAKIKRKIAPPLALQRSSGKLRPLWYRP